MQMHRAGYSYEQIAEELDRTTASVTVRLSVIRKRHGELTRHHSKEVITDRNSLAFPLLCTVFAVIMVYIWSGN